MHFIRFSYAFIRFLMLSNASSILFIRFHKFFIGFHTLSYAFHTLSYAFYMLSYTFKSFYYAFICFSYTFIRFSYAFIRFHTLSYAFICFLYPFICIQTLLHAFPFQNVVTMFKKAKRPSPLSSSSTCTNCRLSRCAAGKKRDCSRLVSQ